jgi:hypothetical protein
MEYIPPLQLPARKRSLAFGPCGWTGLLLVVLGAGGCVRIPTKQPKAEVKSLQAKPAASTSVTPTTLQAQVMRLADEYSMAVSEAADDFAAKIGTFEARQVAARLKLGQATAAVVNAAGQSPMVNALDLVVLASASRLVTEDYLVGQRFGDQALPLLAVIRRLETNAWALITSVLKPEQQEELRALIRDWRVNNPNQHYVGAVRFREFAEAAGITAPQAIKKPNSIFSLLMLDPMAGLDPTVRAVEETRYLAERAFYYGQRLPILLSWQVEFLTLQLSDQPAARQVLTNANQISASLETFSETATKLPQLIHQEREAALQQFFMGIATERSNLLANLASEEGKMRHLLTETRGTLQSAGEMAIAVNAAVQSLESFVRYVAPPKTNAAAQPANPNRRPFDVLDYGVTAGQIGAMAKEINMLLASVSQSSTQAAQLGQQAAANLERTMQRGFWLAVVLIVLLLAGATAAALSYRLLVAKLPRPQRGPES